MMGCGGMMIGGFVITLLVIAGLVAGVFFLVRALRQDGRVAERGGPSAIAILEERYARGELDEEEFARRREALLAGR